MHIFEKKGRAISGFGWLSVFRVAAHMGGECPWKHDKLFSDTFGQDHIIFDLIRCVYVLTHLDRTTSYLT